MPAGRPSKYTKELAIELCSVIAESDRGLDDICSGRDDFPAARTVRTWILENEEFQPMYARAKEIQADFIAHQVLPLADICRVGEKTIVKPSGTEITRGDMVERSRLQVDARKWLAAKLAPKKYGDKVTQEHTGADGGPIETKADVVIRPQITREEWLAIHVGTTAGATTSCD